MRGEEYLIDDESSKSETVLKQLFSQVFVRAQQSRRVVLLSRPRAWKLPCALFVFFACFVTKLALFGKGLLFLSEVQIGQGNGEGAFSTSGKPGPACEWFQVK